MAAARGGGRHRCACPFVDDAPKMSSLLQRAFREDGYAVDVQASGHDAVWMGCECDFDAVRPASAATGPPARS